MEYGVVMHISNLQFQANISHSLNVWSQQKCNKTVRDIPEHQVNSGLVTILSWITASRTIPLVKFPQGRLPPGPSPLGELPPINWLLENYPWAIASHEIPFTKIASGLLLPHSCLWIILPGQLSLIKFSSAQLLRSVSSCVFLSLNFTVAKPVLQLGILVEGKL